MDNNGSSTKSFYILDFIKSLMRPRRIPLIIYLFIDSLFVFVAFLIVGHLFFENSFENSDTLVAICIISAAVIYIGAMILSLSKVGEAYLRWQLGCKPITNQAIYNRIKPIFDEVYESAMQHDPTLSPNIQLFMQIDDDPNAFATGRNTVCVTSGLLSYSDEEIKGVLAHEFGHLAHKDTDLTLVVNVANRFIHWIFAIIWVVLIAIRFLGYVLAFIFNLFSRGGSSLAGAITNIFNTIFSTLALLTVKLIEKAWNIIGNLVIKFADRDAEFNADAFAQQIGFGDGLIRFFWKLPDANVGQKSKLTLIISKMSTIGRSHPETWRRIERLENANQDLLSA